MRLRIPLGAVHGFDNTSGEPVSRVLRLRSHRQAVR
jgi:hypothetical protein